MSLLESVRYRHALRLIRESFATAGTETRAVRCHGPVGLVKVLQREGNLSLEQPAHGAEGLIAFGALTTEARADIAMLPAGATVLWFERQPATRACAEALCSGLTEVYLLPAGRWTAVRARKARWSLPAGATFATTATTAAHASATATASAPESSTR